MRVRVTTMGKFPEVKEFTINEVRGTKMIDEIQDLITEVYWLTEQEVVKERILGFTVMQVSKE